MKTTNFTAQGLASLLQASTSIFSLAPAPDPDETFQSIPTLESFFPLPPGADPLELAGAAVVGLAAEAAATAVVTLLFLFALLTGGPCICVLSPALG